MSVQRLLKGSLLLVVSIVMVSLLFAGVGKTSKLQSKSNDEIMETSINELADLSIEQLMEISDRFEF